MNQEDEYGTEAFRFGVGLAVQDTGQLRTFGTGATRDSSQEKLDPFGFISPLALHRFSEYMHKHRLQSDGKLRDSDNWKKGMPAMEYVRSLIRHVLDFWLVTSGLSPRFDTKVTDPQEIACSILFNIQGYLHETLQGPKLYTVGQAVNSEYERMQRKGCDERPLFVTGLSKAKRPGLHPNVRMPLEKGEDQVRRMVDQSVHEEVELAFDRMTA